MNDPLSDSDRRQALMDEMLRTGIPQIKLALGEVIDRENARPLPAKYARLLPPTALRVELRDDAAAALQPVATDLERELTDSCNRHGSLYDRRYRVELRRATEPDAPLFAVSAVAGKDGTQEANGIAGEVGEDDGMLLPATSDAIRLAAEPATDWESGRWVLVVEGPAGEPREVFRISEPAVTVGRSADNPGLRPTIAISDAPHVSRRQLALSWESRDGTPGFRVYNLGLNEIHIDGDAIPGAHAGRAGVELTSVPESHTGWLPPSVPLRIGEHGPTLWIDEVPPEPDEYPVDPDATVFD